MSHVWSVVVAASAAVASSSFAAINNGGFENGTFTSQGNFAGGQYRALGTNVPLDWDLNAAGTGNLDRWVQSSAAHSGNKYVYLSGTNPYPNNECLKQRKFDCWGSGETFTFSAFVAAATTSTASFFNFEFDEFNSAGVKTSTVYLFTIPANPAWSDTALSVIPWRQVVQSHTYRTDTVSASFWISTQRPAGAQGSISSIVVDDVACIEVPAPSAAAMLGLAGALSLRRRRR